MDPHITSWAMALLLTCAWAGQAYLTGIAAHARYRRALRWFSVAMVVPLLPLLIIGSFERPTDAPDVAEVDRPIQRATLLTGLALALAATLAIWVPPLINGELFGLQASTTMRPALGEIWFGADYDRETYEVYGRVTSAGDHDELVMMAWFTTPTSGAARLEIFDGAAAYRVIPIDLGNDIRAVYTSVGQPADLGMMPGHSYNVYIMNLAGEVIAQGALTISS